MRPETQSAYLDLANKALASRYALDDRMVTELDGLPDGRVSPVLKPSCAWVLRCWWSGVLPAAYLFYCFFLVTDRGLDSIRQAPGRVGARAIRATHRSNPPPKDEVAQAPKSLITVHTVLGRFQQGATQNDMAAQHDAGAIDHAMPADTMPGQYGETAQAVNSLAQSHIAAMLRSVGLLELYAKGDFSQGDSRCCPARSAALPTWCAMRAPRCWPPPTPRSATCGWSMRSARRAPT